MACGGPVVMTFPDDVDGTPLVVWKEHPPEAGGRVHEFVPMGTDDERSCRVCGYGIDHPSHFVVP